jgi:hypothetical protein
MEADNQNEPQWDVALEALLLQTYQSSKNQLGMDGLQELPSKHTIRLDDILDTLCLLSEHKVWTYYDTDGNATKPNRAARSHRLY